MILDLKQEILRVRNDLSQAMERTADVREAAAAAVIVAADAGGVLRTCTTRPSVTPLSLLTAF